MNDRERPVVLVPGTPAPLELAVEDIETGEGVEVGPGMSVSVHYVGVAWSTKAEFDSSWSRGEPLNFVVGANQVIAGFDEGIRGMRVGGRRRVVIPPHLGYGTAGSGLFVRPNETLVFVLDVLDASEPTQRQRRGRRFGRG